jgi:hypothetical protein
MAPVIDLPRGFITVRNSVVSCVMKFGYFGGRRALTAGGGLSCIWPIAGASTGSPRLPSRTKRRSEDLPPVRSSYARAAAAENVNR